MRNLSRTGRRAAPLLASLCMLAPSWAAISVSDVSLAPKPNAGATVIISYRLNEPATSVDIAISNGTHLSGGTAAGINTVEYTPTTGGLTATITATGAQENGTGGAVQLIPVTLPDSPNITGVDWFRRPNSVQRDHIALASGYGTAGNGKKKLYMLASDGSMLVNLNTGFPDGSAPFGVAVAQEDPADRVWLASRAGGGFVQVYTPAVNPFAFTTDATYKFTTTTNYMAMSVVPVPTTPAATDFSMFLGDNKNGRLRRYTGDFSAAPPVFAAGDPLTVAQTNASGVTGNDDPQSVAVDPTAQVMFKAQVHDSGIGLISETDATETTCSANLNKWISTDGGVTWTIDATWSAGIFGPNGIPEATVASAYGVALDKGFDANNLANSKIWVSVGTTTAPAVRKIYHVRADNGEIIAADTIDLDQITLVGTEPLNTKIPRYLSVSRTGNIALTVGGTTPTNATHYTILAPNTAGPTSDSATIDIVVPLLLTAQPSPKPSVGNSGLAQITYSADLYDPSGIVADGAQVSIDLSPLGGPAAQAMTMGTPSADGKSATFTYTYTIPASVTPASYSLAVHATTTSGTKADSTIAQAVYGAFKPDWAITTDGGINSSPAANGKWAYVGTDTGKIYAVDAATGTPLNAFGAGGVASVGEPIKGKIQIANGKLYVPGTTKVFILNAGTGATIATATVPEPNIAIVPNSDDPTLQNRIVVGGSDNKVRLLNATTGAQVAISADLGAKVYKVAVGPSAGYDGNGNPLTFLVVAGTESFTDGSNVTGGRIYMLAPKTLVNAFPTVTNPVLVDSKGAVKSRAAFGVTNGGENFFAIGGASGLWGVNADTGEPFAWTVDGSAGSNGNPYATSAPVDCNPTITGTLPSSAAPTIHFATSTGSIYGIVQATGARISWGGDPINITNPPGTGGFPEGAGILANLNYNLADPAAKVRRYYIGSDANDQRFFSVLRTGDDSTYGAKPEYRNYFEPADTVTYPASLGYKGGSFNSVPAMAGTEVVVGSAVSGSEGRFYGFPALMTADPAVISVTPALGASGIATSASITLVYNKDMSAAQVDSTTFRLLDESGASVDATPALQADGVTVVIAPAAALIANKTYSVVAIPAGAAPFTSTFYTGIPAVVKGDVNGDGAFNSQDVKDAMKMAGGLLSASDKAIQALGKTKPYSITVQDALFLDRVLNGKASF